MCPDDICGPMFHLKVKVTKPGHRAPSDCCSVTTDKHHRILRRCIPCSRLTQQIKSTGFLLQSSEEEIVSFKWNTVFYGRFKIPLVCVLWMCLLDLIRIWTKNSGNSSNLRAVAAHTAVMGWLKHSASSSAAHRPRCWSCLTKKQTGDSSISVARASSVRGRTGSLTEQRADLASARAQHYCDERAGAAAG